MKKIISTMVAVVAVMSFSMIAVAAEGKKEEAVQADKAEKKDAKKDEKKDVKKDAKKDAAKPAVKAKKELSGC